MSDLVATTLAVAVVSALAAFVALVREDRLRQQMRKFMNTGENVPQFPRMTGTLNQVILTRKNGILTFSLPQNIDQGANVTFQTVTTTGRIITGSLTSTGPISGASLAVTGGIAADSINAVSATFTGPLTAGSFTAASFTTGAITAVSATLSGALTAASGAFSGAVTAASSTLSGALTAASGSFSGTVTANNLNATNNLSVGNIFSGNLAEISTLQLANGSFTQTGTITSPVSIGIATSGNITLAAGAASFTTTANQQFTVSGTFISPSRNVIITGIGFTSTGGNAITTAAPIIPTLVSVNSGSFVVAMVPFMQADSALGTLTFASGTLNFVII